MKFSKYIWDLYLQSKKGRAEIAFFQPNNLKAIAEKNDFYTRIEFENDTFTPFEYLKKELKKKQIGNHAVTPKQIFEDLIISEVVKSGKRNYFLYFIQSCSSALYHCFPEFFVPFYFEDNFQEFTKVCKDFDIHLPPLPARDKLEERAWFYFFLSESLQKFRKQHRISTKDFPAFLHGFALESLVKIEEDELPKPSMAYFLGGSKWDSDFLDNAVKEDTMVWGAGSLNIHKGDILVMYCLAPRSYIHSIWRAMDDSYVNPFSPHYYHIEIGYPILVPQITFHELKENVVFKNHPTIRGNMQGLNGRPIKTHDYFELKNLFSLKDRNFKIDSIPKLPVYERNNLNINYESDVEEQLVEPLLKDLGFAENEWIRQMPLRMGRSTKYYPDYAILAKSKKGDEKAKYILEAKFSISNNRQLEEAFLQASSYALRLQAEKIILADLDFVWVFHRKNGNFDNVPIFKKHWNELNSADNIHLLKKLFQK